MDNTEMTNEEAAKKAQESLAAEIKKQKEQTQKMLDRIGGLKNGQANNTPRA